MLRWCFVVLVLHAWIVHGEEVSEPASSGDSSTSSVVIDRVVSFPEYEQTDTVLLRNIGENAVDLRGWWLADSKKDKNDVERSYLFADKEGCEAYSGIPAGGVVELTPLREINPCGFPFGVSIVDELNLYNGDDELVAYASWDWSLQGLALRRMPDGTYERMRENHSIKRVLEDYSDMYLFRDALKATGLMEKLAAKNGDQIFPELPFESINDANPHQLPASMGVEADSLNWPVKYDKMSFDGVPADGPYTILAPTSQALKDFLENWGPGKGLSREEAFKLPEFKKIMESHIIPGSWMTGIIFHNTELATSSGVSLKALKDSKESGGKLKFRPVCIDAQPPGDFTCAEQMEFGKCDNSYITGSGFCLRTCNACGCVNGECAEAVHSDIYASNGLVHIVNKIVAPGAPGSLHDSSTSNDEEEEALEVVKPELESSRSTEETRNSGDLAGGENFEEAETMNGPKEEEFLDIGNVENPKEEEEENVIVEAVLDVESPKEEEEEEPFGYSTTESQSRTSVITSSSASASAGTVDAIDKEEEEEVLEAEDVEIVDENEEEGPLKYSTTTSQSRTSVVTSSSASASAGTVGSIDEEEEEEVLDGEDVESVDEDEEEEPLEYSTTISQSRTSVVTSSSASASAGTVGSIDEEEEEEVLDGEDVESVDEEEEEEPLEYSTSTSQSRSGVIISSSSASASGGAASSSTRTSSVISSSSGRKPKLGERQDEDGEETDEEDGDEEEIQERKKSVFSRTSSTVSRDGIVFTTSDTQASEPEISAPRPKPSRNRKIPEEPLAVSSRSVSLSWSSGPPASSSSNGEETSNKEATPVSRTG